MTAAIKFKTTTSERFWEMLECLPPACQTGAGFLVGEPYDHDAAGRPRFTAFFEARPDGTEAAYYQSARPMTVAEFKATTIPMVRANLTP